MSTQNKSNEGGKSQNSPQRETNKKAEAGSAESFGQSENDIENFGRLNTAEGNLNSDMSQKAHAERPKIDSPDPQTNPETDEE